MDKILKANESIVYVNGKRGICRRFRKGNDGLFYLHVDLDNGKKAQVGWNDIETEQEYLERTSPDEY